MKWVVLAGLIIGSIVLVGLFRSKPSLVRIGAFGLGLLPSLEPTFHLFAAPIAWPAWQGIIKGTEVSASDAVAFALLVTSGKAKSPTALRIAFGGIILAYGVSTSANGFHMESLFFGWEIVRALIVYLALLRATVRDEKVPVYVLTGLIAGLVIQAGVVIQQFAHGTLQAGGWYGHQNLLGFTTHFAVYPAFALFLAGYFRKRMILCLAAGAIIAFTGASRATIGLMVGGICATTVFSIWHHRTGQKWAVVAAALIGVVVVSPLLYTAIGRRSVEQREDSTKDRELMKSAAAMMLSDYPLGVGANRYVVVANIGGYSDRAGVPWDPGSRSAPVHNSYYLAAAEMGWLGLGAMIGLLVAAFTVAVSTLRRAPRGLEGELAAGLAATILMVAIHANFEWVFFIHPCMYFLAISLGVLAGLYARVRRARGGSVKTRPSLHIGSERRLSSATG